MYTSNLSFVVGRERMAAEVDAGSGAASEGGALIPPDQAALLDPGSS